MKPFKNLNRSLTVVGFLMLISLAGCAGKAKSTDNEADANNAASVDLTRPPVTIRSDKEREQESNPDETISFEKWNKEQQAPAAGDE